MMKSLLLGFHCCTKLSSSDVREDVNFQNIFIFDIGVKERDSNGEILGVKKDSDGEIMGVEERDSMMKSPTLCTKGQHWL